MWRKLGRLRGEGGGFVGEAIIFRLDRGPERSNIGPLGNISFVRTSGQLRSYPTTGKAIFPNEKETVPGQNALTFLADRPPSSKEGKKKSYLFIARPGKRGGTMEEMKGI